MNKKGKVLPSQAHHLIGCIEHYTYVNAQRMPCWVVGIAMGEILQQRLQQGALPREAWTASARWGR